MYYDRNDRNDDQVLYIIPHMKTKMIDSDRQ